MFNRLTVELFKFPLQVNMVNF